MKFLLCALYLFVWAVPIVGAAQNQQPAQAKSPGFAIRITTPQENVKTASKIWLDIEWINKSGKKVMMPKASPLSPIYVYKIKVYDEAGKMPPRTPTGHDYLDQKPGLVIGSGAPIGAPIESVAHYDLEDGQSYHQGDLELSDLFVLGPGKYTIQLEKENEDKIVVKSNILTITVTP